MVVAVEVVGYGFLQFWQEGGSAVALMGVRFLQLWREGGSAVALVGSGSRNSGVKVVAQLRWWGQDLATLA